MTKTTDDKENQNNIDTERPETFAEKKRRETRAAQDARLKSLGIEILHNASGDVAKPELTSEQQAQADKQAYKKGVAEEAEMIKALEEKYRHRVGNGVEQKNNSSQNGFQKINERLQSVKNSFKDLLTNKEKKQEQESTKSSAKNSIADAAKTYYKNPARIFTGLSIVKELNRHKGEIAGYAIEHPVKTAAFGLAMVAGAAVLGTAVAASGALLLAGPGGIAVAATVGLTAAAAGSIAFQVASSKLIVNANESYKARQQKDNEQLNQFSLVDPVVPNPSPVQEQNQQQTTHMSKTGPETNVKRRTESLNQKLDEVPYKELKQDIAKLPRSKSVEDMINYYKAETKSTENNEKIGPTLSRERTLTKVNRGGR